MIFEELNEKLLTVYTSNEYSQEVVDAKKDFFEQAGIVDDDSSNFEVRMAQFLDWFIFTRELTKTHMTPVQMCVESPPSKLDESERKFLPKLLETRHSLFEFDKARGPDVYVRDLFTGKKVTIRDSNVTAGFNQDEIFEARIVPVDATYTFCKGFCFHPPEAKKFILKEIKKVKHLDQTQQEALMLRLLKMRYKFEQYKHIRIEFIYTNDAKLKI